MSGTVLNSLEQHVPRQPGKSAAIICTVVSKCSGWLVQASWQSSRQSFCSRMLRQQDRDPELLIKEPDCPIPSVSAYSQEKKSEKGCLKDKQKQLIINSNGGCNSFNKVLACLHLPQAQREVHPLMCPKVSKSLFFLFLKLCFYFLRL